MQSVQFINKFVELNCLERQHQSRARATKALSELPPSISIHNQIPSIPEAHATNSLHPSLSTVRYQASQRPMPLRSLLNSSAKVVLFTWSLPTRLRCTITSNPWRGPESIVGGNAGKITQHTSHVVDERKFPLLDPGLNVLKACGLYIPYVIKPSMCRRVASYAC